MGAAGELVPLWAQAGCKPVSTLLGVTRLFQPEIMIEIEAILPSIAIVVRANAAAGAGRFASTSIETAPRHTAITAWPVRASLGRAV
jgi:hypothetical protein